MPHAGGSGERGGGRGGGRDEAESGEEGRRDSSDGVVGRRRDITARGCEWGWGAGGQRTRISGLGFRV